MVVTSIAVVLVLAAAGVGWLVLHGHAGHATASGGGSGQHQRSGRPAAGSSSPGPASPSTASPSPSPSGPLSSGPLSSAPVSSAPAPSAPVSAPGGSSAGSGPGSTAVALSPAALQYSSAQQVGTFASRYFTAINERNYGAYVALFAPNGQLVPTRGQFESGYRSTADSRATLASLAPIAGGGWAAGLSFVSHQAVAQSRTGTPCTAWRITLFLAPDGSGYLIGSPPPDYRSSYYPCA
jgi:hypothetical protein